MKKSLFGLSENIVSAVAYAGLFFTGIFVYIMERENKTVRFHGLQSTVFFAAWCVFTKLVSFLIGWLPLVGWVATSALSIIGIAAYAFLIYNAYSGKLFKIPVLGDVVWEQVNK